MHRINDGRACKPAERNPGITLNDKKSPRRYIIDRYGIFDPITGRAIAQQAPGSITTKGRRAVSVKGLDAVNARYINNMAAPAPAPPKRDRGPVGV